AVGAGRRRGGRADGPVGPAGGRHPGGGDALRLRPGAARVRHVASALLLSFPDELRHRRAGRAALRGRPRADVAGRAGLGLCLLSPRDAVAAPPGAALSGRGVAPVALHRLPPGADAEGPGAVGAAAGAAVRGGDLDPLPTDADARHPLREERSLDRTARALVWLVLVPALFLAPSSLLRADGGAVRLRERAGGYQ